MRTFKDVFPHYHAFSTLEKGVDMLMLGSESPMVLDRARAARFIEMEELRPLFNRCFVDGPDDLFARLFLGEAEWPGFVGAGPLHRDDLPILEYETPLDMVLYDRFEPFFKRFYYGERPHGAPFLYLAGYEGPDRASRLDSLARALLAAGKPAMAAETARKAHEAGAIDALQVVAASGLARLDIKEIAAHAELFPLEGPGLPGTREVLPILYHVRRGNHQGAMELLAMLPGEAKALEEASSFTALSGLVLLEGGLVKSAMAALDGFAKPKGEDPCPVGMLLLGRALMEDLRFKDGARLLVDYVSRVDGYWWE